MTQRLRPLWLAMVLLTTLPVGRWIGPDVTAGDQGRSVAWYPWVGALIGLVLWLVMLLTSAAPAMVQAILVLVAWAALTGGLHLDGLADCIDGAFAGHGDTTRTLAVMREPTAGPMAIIALAIMAPPPMPCTPLKTMSWVMLWLSPAKTEPTKNTAIPAM